MRVCECVCVCARARVCVCVCVRARFMILNHEDALHNPFLGCALMYEIKRDE